MATHRPTLTPGQKQVLRLLQRLPEGITMADLAERLDITLYAAGKALKALADEHKLVVRATLGSGALWATKEHGVAIVEKRRADRAAVAVPSHVCCKATRSAGSASAPARRASV